MYTGNQEDFIYQSWDGHMLCCLTPPAVLYGVTCSLSLLLVFLRQMPLHVRPLAARLVGCT